MEVPKMKIFIYMLTFLGYAWSGYGAGVITNFRDAILAAEHIFVDVLETIVAVAKRWKTVNEIFLSADEECTFTCPDGVKPVRNKYHRPSSNGCGTLGLQVPTEHLPVAEMTQCCDEHDLCYDTCNQEKTNCDIQFRRCLYNICDNYLKNVGENVVNGCKTAAKMLFTGTVTMGCKSYIDSQKEACFCGSTKGKVVLGGEYGEL